MHTTGRHEEREGRRLQPIHRLGQEHQTIGKDVGMDNGSHR